MAKALFVRAHAPYSRWQVMATSPMGLMYLSAMLRRNGHETKIIDGVIDPHWMDHLQNLVSTWRPDVVGFSLLSLDIDSVAESVRRLRESSVDALLVGGGPGAAFADEKQREYLDLDAIVRGEGEFALPEMIQAHRQGGGLRGVAGLWVKAETAYVDTGPRPEIADLDALPLPDRETVDLPRYFGKPSMDLMWRHPRWASILTSRSCPFNCSFCAHAMGRGYRTRSAENVMREIDWLVDRYGIGELQIIDDLFNLDRERTAAICHELLDRPYKLHLVFPNGLRLDHLDNELIRLMRRAGFDRLLAPIETASPRLQKAVGKNLNIDKALAAIREMYRLGVFVRVTTMLGFPTETYEEMKHTYRTAFSVPAQWVSINQVMPLPGSQLARDFDAEVANGDWRYVNFVRTTINLSTVPLRKINRLKRKVLYRMLLPHRIYRLLRDLPRNNLAFYVKIFLLKLFQHTVVKHPAKKLDGRSVAPPQPIALAADRRRAR